MKLRRSLHARPEIVRGEQCTGGASRRRSRAADTMAPAFVPRTITQGALARDLPETALHVTSRRLTPDPSTAPLTSVVVWAREVLRGVVNSPSINGMEKGSGVQIPSAPPPQHRRSQAYPSFQRRFLLLPDCPIRATRVPLGAGGALSVRLEAASISSSKAAAMAASRPAITCW
jgi:hypothetical protein